MWFAFQMARDASSRKSYNTVHKLRSGFAPALVWKHLLERVPNAKESLPEEFYDEYDQIRDDILQKLEKALTTIRIFEFMG